MKEHKISGHSYNETKAFSYLAKVSDEKKGQSEHILKEVQGLKDKGSFLDVGAGAGDIFLKVYNEFDNSVAVEPGLRMFEILEKGVLDKSKVELFNMKWNEFYDEHKEEYQGKFDLIVLVHSIYFFDEDKETLNKMLGLLKPSGKLIVIVGGKKGNGQKGFIHYFRDRFLGSVSAKKEYEWIESEFPNVRKILFPSKVRMISFEELKELGEKSYDSPTNYFLKFALKRWYDEYLEEEIEEMKNFIKENEEIDSDGNYVLRGVQKMYVIEK